MVVLNGLFQKKNQTGGKMGWGYIFWNPPGNFRFVTLTIDILEKTNFRPWKFGTIALSYPPWVRVRATVKLSAASFHYESSITIGGGVKKCNSTENSAKLYDTPSKFQDSEPRPMEVEIKYIENFKCFSGPLI